MGAISKVVVYSIIILVALTLFTMFIPALSFMVFILMLGLKFVLFGAAVGILVMLALFFVSWFN